MNRTLPRALIVLTLIGSFPVAESFADPQFLLSYFTHPIIVANDSAVTRTPGRLIFFNAMLESCAPDIKNVRQ